jgi:hypothetical protein
MVFWYLEGRGDLNERDSSSLTGQEGAMVKGSEEESPRREAHGVCKAGEE